MRTLRILSLCIIAFLGCLYPVQASTDTVTLTVTATPPTGYAPLSVALKATVDSSSSTIKTWTWNFGDGIYCNDGPSCGLNVVHIFSAVKSYTVSFSATDNLGSTSSLSTTIVTTKKPADTVKATLVVTSGNNSNPGKEVLLSMTVSSSNGTVTQTVWNCNNGSVTVGQHPTYGPLELPPTQALSGTMPTQLYCVYSTSGTFNPSIIVTDSLGNTATATVPVTVSK